MDLPDDTSAAKGIFEDAQAAEVRSQELLKKAFEDWRALNDEMKKVLGATPSQGF